MQTTISETKMPRRSAIAYLCFSILGLLASFELVISEMTLLKNPNATLGCDLNPLVGCGSILQLPVSHLLFGISNAVIGIIAFSALSMMAFLLVVGNEYPLWLWQVVMVATLGAIGYVFFFQWYSIFVKNSLCPWCFVIWMSTIPIFVITWANGLKLWGEQRGKYKWFVVWNNRWVIISFWWFLVIATVLLRWWSQWVTILF